MLKHVLVALLVSACATSQPPAADTTAWPDTATAEWVALTIGGAPLVPGTRVTVQTSSGGVGGYTGCNWYGLRRDSTRFLVEMSARGCRADIQEQELRLTTLLTRAVRAIRGGDTATLLDSTGAALMTLARRHRTGATREHLVAASWRLATSTVAEITHDSVVVRFTADSVTGFGGCRQLFATYLTTNDRLRFTHIETQPMECPDKRARISEEHLTTVFSETEHFAVQGDMLTITTFGGDTLRFRKVSGALSHRVTR